MALGYLKHIISLQSIYYLVINFSWFSWLSKPHVSIVEKFGKYREVLKKSVDPYIDLQIQCNSL